jgi:hypothetical protein
LDHRRHRSSACCSLSGNWLQALDNGDQIVPVLWRARSLKATIACG